MVFKKIGQCIIILMVVLMLCIPAYADSTDIIYQDDVDSTDEFLVKITRPEGDESTFKKSYVICGNTDIKGIRVELAILEDDGKWKSFENTDGDSSWRIGNSGIFMKEVRLPELGANKIRIAAYKSDEKDRLVLNENLQLQEYTITVLEKSFKDKIKSGFISVTEMLDELINKANK